MERPIFQIDAFTSQRFRGNPAAVVPLDGWLDDAVLQNIAAENNLAETAFLVPEPEVASNDFHLRWFTPVVEVSLCGHATLAAAHALIHHLGFPKPAMSFRTRSGPLSARHDPATGLLTLDFPAIELIECDSPPGFSDALGVRPSLMMRPAQAVNAENVLFAVFEDAMTVRSLMPDMSALRSIEGGCACATAPGDGPEADFVSRFFAPGAGIDEDPVTGSTHAALAPFWARRLSKTSLRAQQLSRRGGQIFCGTSAQGRILLQGHAVTYLQGTIVF